MISRSPWEGGGNGRGDPDTDLAGLKLIEDASGRGGTSGKRDPWEENSFDRRTPLVFKARGDAVTSNQDRAGEKRHV